MKKKQQYIASFFEEKQKSFNLDVKRFKTSIANISQKQYKYGSFATMQSIDNPPNIEKNRSKLLKISQKADFKGQKISIEQIAWTQS